MAQNDSGLFEPNLRDERYLPFEGCGAISSWCLELPKEGERSWGLTLNIEYERIKQVDMNVLCWFNLFD